MTLPFIRPEDIEHRLNWTALGDAIIEGHTRPRAQIGDILFERDRDAMLNRAAWIDGAGIGVKTANIFPGNVERTPPMPSIHAVFTLFDDKTGEPAALIDGILVTKWKTAGDSVLGARLLARPDSKTMIIVGAGAVADSLIDAYREVFPGLQTIRVWNRTRARAEELAKAKGVEVADDLREALADADIVASATMSTEPVIKGAWIGPGTHVDLIGAFRPDMREADDELIARAELFVDARETAHDIGELMIPIASGVITDDHVRADYYDIASGAYRRSSPDAVTMFKNGGGAHLDLMTALYIKGVSEA
ncbi:MAG: Gfo/Idh/MocA family oxidoreductase [Rhodospirillales bacterium]